MQHCHCPDCHLAKKAHCRALPSQPYYLAPHLNKDIRLYDEANLPPPPFSIILTDTTQFKKYDDPIDRPHHPAGHRCLPDGGFLDMNNTLFATAQSKFLLDARPSQDEEERFKSTTLQNLREEIHRIQQKHAKSRSMKYMQRLEPFLFAMERYGKVVEIFVNSSDMVAFIWVRQLRWTNLAWDFADH